MLLPVASRTKTVRTVFFIDAWGIGRAILYYPLLNGRNPDEIVYLLAFMQTFDKYGTGRRLTGSPTMTDFFCDWLLRTRQSGGKPYSDGIGLDRFM